MKDRIVWSRWAKEDLSSISKYWNQRNHSPHHSHKIVERIVFKLNQIQQFPDLAQNTELADVRSILALHYRVLFKQLADSILVIMVWDARRSPEELELTLKRRLEGRG